MNQDQQRHIEQLLEDSTTTPIELAQALEMLSYTLVKGTKEYKERLNTSISGLSFKFAELGDVSIDLE